MSFNEIIEILKKNIKLIIIPIVISIICAVYIWGFMDNLYTSRIDIYVLSKTNPATQTFITQNDMSASQQLTNDVAVLVKSNRVRNAVQNDLNVDTFNEYDIDVSSTDKNRVITLSVTGKNPVLATRIVDSVAKQTAKLAVDIMNVEAINIIDVPEVPSKPSGPPRLLYLFVSFCIGLVLAIVIIFIKDMLDTTIKDKNDFYEKFKIPVLAQFSIQKDLK